MGPYDIMSEEEWARVLDGFAEQTRMAVSLTDAEGTILAGSGERPPVCRRIRDNPEALTSVCSQSNQAMLAVARQTGEPVVELCEAGLMRIAVPVMKDDELAAQITACGRLPTGSEVETFLVSKLLGIEELEVERLAEKSTPPLTEEEAARLAEAIKRNLPREA